MTKQVFLFLCIVCTPILLFSGTRGNFLSHGPSVAAFGRGETGTAKLSDVSCVYYNPALSAYLDGKSVNLSYYRLYEGSSYGFFGFKTPTKENISLAFSGIILRSGDIDIREEIDKPLGTANTNQCAFIFSGARTMEKLLNTSMGFNLKYIYQDLYNDKDGALGVDFGAANDFKVPEYFGNRSAINVGFAVQNIYQPTMKLAAETETYGPIYRFGIAVTLPVYSRAFSYDTFGVFSDAVYSESDVKYFTGLEYSFLESYFFRSGYYKEHLTLGLGYANGRMSVDYAADLISYTSFHRLGLSFYWDGKEKMKRISLQKPQNPDNALMQEAQAAYTEDKQTRSRLEKEIRPFFALAKKEFKRKRYLLATDAFGELMLKYPDYAIAQEYYNKIVSLMETQAKDADTADLEKLAYAKGYILYRQKQLSDALNEWEKSLQFNPKNSELREYSAKTKTYLADLERLKKEAEIEKNAEGIYQKGVEFFSGKKWVSCIKEMEKVQFLCKQEPFQGSAGWYNRSQEYIEKSVKKLAQIVAENTSLQQVERDKEQEWVADIEGSKKKYHEGLILYAQGKLADAVHLWEIALRLDPANEKAKQARDKSMEELDALRQKQ